MSFMHRNKAQRTVVNGISFPSRTEAELYAYLRQLEVAGHISDLIMQSKVEPQLCQSCGCRPAPSVKVDFRFTEKEKTVWAESKGISSDRWLAFLAWWRHSGPGTLRIYNMSGKRIKLIEEVMP